MTEKEILKKSAEEYNRLILDEISELDKEIEDLGITVPIEVTAKLEKETGLNLNGENQKRIKGICSFRFKIAAVILVFVAAVASISVGYPVIVTAVKNAKYNVEYNNKKESIDIVFHEAGRIKYLFSIPEGFELDTTSQDTDFIRHTYKDTSKPEDYITISCYTNDYSIYHDNEDCDVFDDIDINGNTGKLFVKNGITTIIFMYQNDLIEISSNLPEKEIQAIAESIQQ